MQHRAALARVDLLASEHGIALPRHAEDYAGADPIAALEALRAEVAQFPVEPGALADVYPEMVRLAARALLALGSLPEPDEVDGLSGFEGFDLWRQSR